VVDKDGHKSDFLAHVKFSASYRCVRISQSHQNQMTIEAIKAHQTLTRVIYPTLGKKMASFIMQQ